MDKEKEELARLAYRNAADHAFSNMKGHGVFADLGDDDETPPSKDCCKDNPSLKMGKVSTMTERGTTMIHAKDYPMAWKNHHEKAKPSTTHELCFDQHNGFDAEFLYVSGMSKSKIARVSKVNPMRQVAFYFKDPPTKCVIGKVTGAAGKAEPHTIKFANVEREDAKGILWVGLENWGLIVSLNMPKILKKYPQANIDAAGDDIDAPCVEVTIQPDDYETVLDVRLHGAGTSIPTPINTKPHGFCFDANYEMVYFTGKLTNTVGRIKIHGSEEEGKGSLQHFQIPTQGAVPINISLGPDGNVWGTCLNTGFIFRCTTGENPCVTEIPIHQMAANRKPIVIIADSRPKMPFMWFSTEGGHSVCRLDTKAFQKKMDEEEKDGKDSSESNCVCSTGCQWLFNKKAFHRRPDVISEFPVPKMNHNMKLGGIAMSKKGEIWTQSYIGGDNSEGLSDYVIKLSFNIHYPSNTHDESRKITGSSVVAMTGVPIEYFELPTKNTILHRISCAPDDQPWFTELAVDRIGTVTVGPRVKKSKREGDVLANHDQKKQK